MPFQVVIACNYILRLYHYDLKGLNMAFRVLPTSLSIQSINLVYVSVLIIKSMHPVYGQVYSLVTWCSHLI